MTSFGTRATAFEDRSDMGSSFSKINSVSAVLERERERETGVGRSHSICISSWGYDILAEEPDGGRCIFVRPPVRLSARPSAYPSNDQPRTSTHGLHTRQNGKHRQTDSIAEIQRLAETVAAPRCFHPDSSKVRQSNQQQWRPTPVV